MRDIRQFYKNSPPIPMPALSPRNAHNNSQVHGSFEGVCDSGDNKLRKNIDTRLFSRFYYLKLWENSHCSNVFWGFSFIFLYFWRYCSKTQGNFLETYAVICYRMLVLKVSLVTIGHQTNMLIATTSPMASCQGVILSANQCSMGRLWLARLAWDRFFCCVGVASDENCETRLFTRNLVRRCYEFPPPPPHLKPYLQCNLLYSLS